MLRRSWLLLLLGALTLGGCGKELTAGGFREGEVSAAATDEREASSTRFAAARQAVPAQGSSATIGGLVGLTATVSLVTESGALIPITEGLAAAEVVIGGAGPVPLGKDSIPEGDYPAVQITFTSVVAEVEGLLLPGTSFTGTVTVDIGSAPLVVDFPVPVAVREDDPSVLILDLNSESWLSLAQPVATIPLTATVASIAFEQAITVTAE